MYSSKGDVKYEKMQRKEQTDLSGSADMPPKAVKARKV
jgi:hypothetical protein